MLKYKKYAKLLLVAVAGLGIWLVVSFDSISDRAFVLRQSERDNGNIVLNNSDKIISEDLEGEAYTRIEDELGIEALRINDRPSDMIFTSLEVEDSKAILTFSYNGKNIKFVQGITFDFNINSDIAQSVFNDWISEDIVINKKVIADEIEYSSIIKVNGVHYIISGMIDLEDFIMIVKDLSF